MANFILSAFADEYSENFTEQLEALKKFDISHLEIRGVDGKNVSALNKEEVKTAKAKLDDYGIKLSAIGSPIGKIKIDGNMEEHLEMVKRVFETAEMLQAKYCRIFSFYAPDGKNIQDYKSQVYEGLEKIVKIAENYNVTLCHENESLIYGESPDKCLEIMEYFGGKMKYVFDMANYVIEGYKPYPDAYQKLVNHIEYFHIKDALYAGAIVPAGKGEGCIKEILDDWRLNGSHDVFITLEPHLQSFSGLNALVGRPFVNPYQYENQKTAFTDAVKKLRELL